MKDSDTPAKFPKDKKGKEFITVGIGASAGGIEALKDFFSNMPPKPGMAFVVILHLSPEHESNLDAIIQKETEMPVIQVNETIKVDPNHVYVIPPSKNLAMVDGTIRLTEQTKNRGTRVAIDLFFRTLANAYGRNAVCVVMSGSGSDGTLGLKQVKENNGFAIVQDPADAQFDAMPRSAIETGLVDWILPTNEMPGKLITYRRSSEKMELTEDQRIPGGVKGIDDLREILTLVRVRTGHDFSFYKRPTLIRRIARHMQIHELDDAGKYLDLLRDNPEEVQSLIKNLLINVTNFFRDREAFAALEKTVIPKLFAGKTSKDTVRIWSAGCASGEEAYSLAILLTEYASRLSDPPKTQVFATDVDEDAIGEARQHRYPETIEADVSPDRLKRFFIKEGDKFTIRKSLRETVLFAPHSVLRDPPFSRLDLVVCRNVLIYLNRETQDRVLHVFHFALRPDGHLFLGNSESAESQSTLFGAVDKKNRIYSRRPATQMQRPPIMPVPGEWLVRIPEAPRTPERDRIYSFGEMHHKLVEQYGPPSILVGEDFEILHVSDTAGRFLRFAGGEPSTNVLKAVHPDLLPDLRAALFSAQRDRKPSEFKNIGVKLTDTETFVSLTVRPVDLADAGSDLLLIIFDETKAKKEKRATAVKPVSSDDAMESVVRGMEEELRKTKIRLRSTIEQHETSIEEQKASNEELQAINEELRSASEELETSKEELQSVNEELTTVNQELKEKIDETGQVNSDLQNLIASTDIGTIFLDRDLHIKRYTPNIEPIFNILPSDVGRPLDHLTHNLNYTHLAADAAKVLKTLNPIEREIVDKSGFGYLARLHPYRTIDDKIEGIVLNFIDINKRLAAEERVRWLATAIDSSNDAMFSFSMDRKIVTWNTGAEKMFGYLEAEAIGRSISMLSELGREKATDEFIKRAAKGTRVENIEVVQTVKGGAEIDISMTLTPVFDDGKKIKGIMAVIRDIRPRKKADLALRNAEERQRLLIESAEDYAICTITREGIVDSWNTGAERVFGYKEKEILGKPAEILFTPEDRKAGIHLKEMKTALKEGRAEDERYHIRKDGTRFYASGVMTLLEGGKHGFAKIARDLTERKLADEALQELKETLETRVEERTEELKASNATLLEEIDVRIKAEEIRIGLLRKIVTTQEDERRRIARDLHDHLGQKLTALRLKMASVKESAGSGTELAKRVARLEEIGEELDAEVNFLAWELRPTALDDLGMVAAIGNYVNEWSRHYEIAADFHSNGLKNKRLDPEIETNLYRITQEALNNVVKHAQASRVSVLLERRQKTVVLIIEDDGTGFDITAKTSVGKSGKGLGLIGMRERAAIVEGQVEIESGRGKGTAIFVNVPYVNRNNKGVI